MRMSIFHTSTGAERSKKRMTCTVDEAGQILGIGRSAAYQAAANGQLPTIRIGRRLLVPLPRLEEMLREGRPS
jgi:excisionase family DNA binding protein